MAVREDDRGPVTAQAVSGPDPRRWKALFVLALVQFMIIIDITVVNVALASPAALALVVLLFTDPGERTRALGIWSGLAGLGGTFGVLISGVIVNFVSWRWIFFVNLPIAVLALILIPGLVSESRAEGTSRRVDIPGAVLVTGGVLALIDGFLAASHHSWGSSAVVWPLVIGVAALLAMIVVERRTRDPLIPMTFFSNRTRVSANLATAVMASGMFGMFFLLTLYLQQVLGYSPLKTGLAYGPFGLGLVAGVAGSTKILQRGGGKGVT